MYSRGSGGTADALRAAKSYAKISILTLTTTVGCDTSKATPDFRLRMLKQLFTLPPAHKRRMLFSFSIQGTGGTTSSIRADDTYIYYLITRTSFLVALFLSLLNLDSQAFTQVLNFYFFVIDLTGSDYLQRFLNSYTTYTATILLLLQLYYIILFAQTSTPEPLLPLGLATAKHPRGTRPRVKYRLLPFITVPCIIAAMYGLFGLYYLIMQGLHLEHSYLYFLLCIITMPFVMAVFNFTLLLTVMTFWRLSGQTTE